MTVGNLGLTDREENQIVNGVHRSATLLGRGRVLRKINRSMRLGPARNGV